MSVDILRRLERLERRLSKLEMREQGLGVGFVEGFFTADALADNVATDVFRVQTTNESGSNDGGVYAVFVEGLVAHAGTPTAANSAVLAFQAQFARAVKNDASVGVNSAVQEVAESGSAATNSVSRDVGTVTMTVVENSEYQCDVQFQVDLTGSSVATATVVVWVRVVYYGFLTPPVLSEL